MRYSLESCAFSKDKSRVKEEPDAPIRSSFISEIAVSHMLEEKLPSGVQDGTFNVNITSDLNSYETRRETITRNYST